MEKTAALEARIFGEASLYAVLDGAACPDLLDKLYGDRPEFECLYRGDLEPDIAAVAPYLVRLEEGAPFTDWLLQQGWGKHWGILAQTQADLPVLHRHFRRFLTVHDESGKPMLFRFYDPRVLPVYLPTCNAEELKAFFGPVERFLVEKGDGVEVFELQNGKLLARSA